MSLIINSQFGKNDFVNCIRASVDFLFVHSVYLDCQMVDFGSQITWTNVTIFLLLFELLWKSCEILWVLGQARKNKSITLQEEYVCHAITHNVQFYQWDVISDGQNCQKKNLYSFLYGHFIWGRIYALSGASSKTVVVRQYNLTSAKLLILFLPSELVLAGRFTFCPRKIIVSWRDG